MMYLSYKQSALSSWGGFKGRRRESDSPYIESVWEGTAQRSGTHLTAADATIDLAFQKKNGVTHLLLSGPTSKVQAAQFDAGDEVLAVRLRTGVYLPSMTGPGLADVNMILPNANRGHFWLNYSSIAFPSFDNVETFTEYLAEKSILHRNLLLENVLQGRSLPGNIRTIQRHCLATTGLTMSRIRQIKRAEHARSLLTADYPLTRVAYEVGYSNSGHMANAFKHFFGYTPSTLRALMRQDR